MSRVLDTTDSALLEAAQEDFPVASHPYEVLASRCGIGAGEAHSRISRMRKLGIIRRLAGLLDSRQLGMVTTLVALDAGPASVDQVAAQLDCYPEVTHSYLREGWPNLWFTLVAVSQERVEAILAEVRGISGVLMAAEVPATRLFKLAVRLPARQGTVPT